MTVLKWKHPKWTSYKQMQLFTRLFVLRLSKKRNNTLTKLKIKLFFFAIFDLRKGEMDCSYTGG